MTGKIYDAVVMWAYGVNRSLEEGYQPNNGMRISDNIFNSAFQGITGMVAIDKVGDRKPDLRYVICRFNISLFQCLQPCKFSSN